MTTITDRFFDKYKDKILAWEDSEAVHIRWMMDEIPKMGDHEGKQMRWLGFVQGWFWSKAIFTIDEMRADNR